MVVRSVLIFRHMPLPQHLWAQRAAEAAACAQFQNQNAFWALHDALFANQAKLTVVNFADMILSLASNISTINQNQFHVCMERQLSLGSVIRDKKLAEDMGVGATPTLFVNGKVAGSIATPAELHRTLQSGLTDVEAATSMTSK